MGILTDSLKYDRLSVMLIHFRTVSQDAKETARDRLNWNESKQILTVYDGPGVEYIPIRIRVQTPSAYLHPLVEGEDIRAYAYRVAMKMPEIVWLYFRKTNDRWHRITARKLTQDERALIWKITQDAHLPKPFRMRG